MQIKKMIKRKGKLFVFKGAYYFKSEAFRRGYLCNKQTKCKYFVCQISPKLWGLYICRC